MDPDDELWADLVATYLLTPGNEEELLRFLAAGAQYLGKEDQWVQTGTATGIARA